MKEFTNLNSKCIFNLTDYYKNKINNLNKSKDYKLNKKEVGEYYQSLTVCIVQNNNKDV